jgi:hypothetical protein
MKYETFKTITDQLKKQDKVISNLYKNRVDLIDLVDPYHDIIRELFISIYGLEGYDWWNWFCYENDYGAKAFEAHDENGEAICQTLEGVWEYIEKNLKLDKA